MESEQKQKKILFAGLTILILSGIFLYSASFLDRNTPVIETLEMASSMPGEDSVEVAPTAKPILSWANYWNKEYGFEVMYPKNWSVPEAFRKVGDNLRLGFFPEGYFEGCCAGLKIEIADEPLEATYKKMIDEFPEEGEKPLFDERISIAGVSAREVVFITHYGAQNLRVTLIPYKNRTILLQRGDGDVVGEKMADSFNFVRIDSAGHRTYRNEEYGFELKYLKAWLVQENISAGVGLPIDCEQTPAECHNIAIVFSGPKAANGSVPYVTLQISPKREGAGVESGGSSSESSSDWADWDKQSPTGLKFSKSNTYFPMYGACYTVAGVPTVTLKREVNYSFGVMYEIPENMTYEDAEEFCKKEYPDPTFDAVVGSLKAI